MATADKVIKTKQAHGNLTRRIFFHLDRIDYETVQHLRAQTHLFIELYNAFYTGIWRHYSKTDTLLRKVSNI